MKTYTIGTTPKEIIIEQFKEHVGNSYYDISFPICSGDTKTIIEAVNQGIDSHLEAITDLKLNVAENRSEFQFNCADLIVLLRRLYEMSENGNENAGCLHSNILYTLGIEEV